MSNENFVRIPDENEFSKKNNCFNEIDDVNDTREFDAGTDSGKNNVELPQL